MEISHEAAGKLNPRGGGPGGDMVSTVATVKTVATVSTMLVETVATVQTDDNHFQVRPGLRGSNMIPP